MDLRKARDGFCTLFNALIKAGKAFKPADRSHATAGILVALAAKTERSGIPRPTTRLRIGLSSAAGGNPTTPWPSLALPCSRA